jgi:osmotically-inducible protein OsmY
MNSEDAKIQRSVFMKLAKLPDLDLTHLEVSVDRGDVILSGHMAGHEGLNIVSRAVRQLPEVKSVTSELTVQPAEHGYTDGDALIWAEYALRQNSDIPQDSVRISLDHGHLTLSGEVKKAELSTAAEQAVRYLRGVRKVTNDLKIA